MSQKLIDDLQTQLSLVSTITELAEERSPSFFNEVKDWMKVAETTLIAHKIASGAQIATFRASLISVDNDGLIPETLNFYRTPSRIKLRRAAATIFMKKTVEVIYNYLLEISAALGNKNRGNDPKRGK
ncbi:MAG: hypothetical protein ACFFCI_01315 [Promethearchaeota archaeon]